MSLNYEEENTIDLFGPEFDKYEGTEATQQLLTMCNTNDGNEELFELRPVQEPQSSSQPPVSPSSKRSPSGSTSSKRRTRTHRSKWTKSAQPLDEKVRPGRKPKISDKDCDDIERRNRRREQNKEAAKRQREKKLAKVRELEEEVYQLKADKKRLSDENEMLNQEVARLRAELENRKYQAISAPEMNSRANVEAINTIQPNYENPTLPNDYPRFLDGNFFNQC